MALEFYERNAKGFISTFSLMADRIHDLGISSVAKDIFIDKLVIIHEARAQGIDHAGG